MQWNSSYQESIFSFANNINTHEGGTHLSGFRSALTRTLNKFAREKGHLKERDENLSGEDVRRKLEANIAQDFRPEDIAQADIFEADHAFFRIGTSVPIPKFALPCSTL